MRLQRGYTLNEAVSKSKRKKGIIAKDHLGNVFISIREMCDFWQVNYKSFLRRLNNGKDIKTCLLGKKAKEDGDQSQIQK